MSVTQSCYMRLSIGPAGFESWMCGVEICCCVLQFAVARRPFVEPRVSSSGETWQAKLIENCNNQCGPGVGSCCFWNL